MWAAHPHAVPAERGRPPAPARAIGAQPDEERGATDEEAVAREKACPEATEAWTDEAGAAEARTGEAADARAAEAADARATKSAAVEPAAEPAHTGKRVG